MMMMVTLIGSDDGVPIYAMCGPRMTAITSRCEKRRDYTAVVPVALLT